MVRSSLLLPFTLPGHFVISRFLHTQISRSALWFMTRVGTFSAASDLLDHGTMHFYVQYSGYELSETFRGRFLSFGWRRKAADVRLPPCYTPRCSYYRDSISHCRFDLSNGTPHIFAVKAYLFNPTPSIVNHFCAYTLAACLTYMSFACVLNSINLQWVLMRAWCIVYRKNN